MENGEKLLPEMREMNEGYVGRDIRWRFNDANFHA